MTSLYPPRHSVVEAVSRALAEDVGALGDLTAALLPERATAKAVFVARREGVLAGRSCAEDTFAQIDPSVELVWELDDGDTIEAGAVLAGVQGRLAAILTAERTALNFLQHLSGIASLTRRFVRAARAGREGARIWDTRKTTPGLRALEKAAVRAGGGLNHRGSLSDFVLVKDNHLAGLTITQAVERGHDRWPGRVVEVECDTLDQVREAMAAGSGMVMLDNMSPSQVAEAVAIVAGRVPVEVSGGITLETVRSYAGAGADLLSVGALTNSAPVLDIGLDLIP
jgi:nicotinate-nucleotide pyrophosphorylase (carboxylating)